MLGIGIAVNFQSTSLVFQYHYALDLVSGVVFYRSDALPVTEPYSCMYLCYSKYAQTKHNIKLYRPITAELL